MDKNLIPLARVRFLYHPDGSPLNPRGRVDDTTELQASMNQEGQIDPILVIPKLSEEDGEWLYYVIRGHRRVVAARALGWTEIWAELDQSADSTSLPALFHVMLSDYVREDLKPLQRGMAARKLIQELGYPPIRAAALLGVTPQKLDLMIALTEADPAIQKRVNAGEMSLSAFDALRYQPAAIQQQVAALEKPTRSAVRNAIRAATAQPALTAIQENAPHRLIPDLRDLRARLLDQRVNLTQSELAQAITLIRELLTLLEEPC